jgi:hypothetical protein
MDNEPVTLDDLSVAAYEVARYNSRVHRAHRRELVVKALEQGMHPWAAANYSGLSERYVRSLGKKEDA